MNRMEAFVDFKKSSLHINGKPVIKSIHWEDYDVNEWFCCGGGICGPGATPEMAYYAWSWLGGMRGK